MMGSSQMSEGAGARAERARTWRVLRVSFATAAGAIAIATAVTVSRIATGTPLGHIPPAAAIAAAVLIPIVLIGGARLSWNASDELDRADTLRACMAAFYAFVSMTVAWMFLEQGDLLPEPSVLALFIATNVVFVAAYLWLRVRRLAA